MKKFDHIFLDFDETIFNHYAFIEWLDALFLEKFDIKPGTFKDDLDKYHDHVAENLRLYHHIAHFESVTGRSWPYISGEIEKALSSEAQDFCYDDAHPAMKELIEKHKDVRILTYGKADYQRFKLNTCNFLRNHTVPVHVVHQPKREFVASEFPDSTGVLVDDKHPLKLPPPWLHVWLVRSESLDAPKRLIKGEIQISSLNQLTAAIST